jgi:hypothetical protein
LTPLFNSIRAAFHDGSLQQVFGEPMARKLFSTTQGVISHWGLMLQSVQRFGRVLADVARSVLQKAGKTAADVDWLIPHQANIRIIEAIAKRLDLPMEKVYARQPKTDISQAFLRETTGGGRVAYFPWDIDRSYWEVLATDHYKLLRNAVAWTTNEAAPVTVSGPGLLDVTLWRQKNSVTVHLVNLSNPMMMKGPVRELLHVGEQLVRVRLPDGLKVRAVHLLVANRTPVSRQTGEWLEVTVPSVLDHEVVAVDV